MIPKQPVEKFRFTPEQKTIMKEIKKIQLVKKMFANMPEELQAQVQQGMSELEQKHQQLLEMMPTELKDSEGQ
jgi:hypothetical protein